MWKRFYINHRFFHILTGVGLCYFLAFFFPKLTWFAHGLLCLLVVLFIVDSMLLFNQKDAIYSQRILPEKLSNGDENSVKIDIKNNYPFRVDLKIIDEIPFQFQKRDFLIKKTILPQGSSFFEYILIPKERGEYVFGGLNIFAKSPIGLVSRKFVFQKEASLPSYPSFVHLRKYELMALQNEFLLGGIKKIRKLGHTMEFEQIRDYVQGDDIRSINWKATSKANKLMVNQYQDEKSQRIYMLIDKGRTMQMPFKGLSLLDYSINAVMALSHIILKKSDRAGMMTFSQKTENKVQADQKSGQLKKISEALYNIRTNFYESDFSRLYQDVKTTISQRSLVLLFTNFETLDAVNRQMKYLRGIARNHLLVVIFFKNSELNDLMNKKPENIQEVYDEIIAEKLEFEKKLIIQELRKYGIFTVYTLPENLNIEVINKYLEIKARGIL
jgi:transmembrane protein